MAVSVVLRFERVLVEARYYRDLVDDGASHFIPSKACPDPCPDPTNPLRNVHAIRRTLLIPTLPT
jgi:hypothetical protein